MGLEKDILLNLNKGPRTYEGLKEAFPYSNLAQILINLEKQYFAVNKEGVWFITEKGKQYIRDETTTKPKERRKIPLAKIGYSLLVVPAIIFFLLSAQYYQSYLDAQHTTQELLNEKAEIEEQIPALNDKEKAAKALYDEKIDELTEEQGRTSQLSELLTSAKNVVESLEEDLDYYDCLERCTPDTFVTVDNAYVKAKVDELIAGLTTLRQKQEAVYEFVRDEIEDDEYLFRMGRTDLWEYPEDILKRGKGHYEDKYMLLMTMLRIAGTPAEHVRFLQLEVDGNDNWVFVEVYDGTTWWLLDPFEGYVFTSTNRDEFFDEHDVVILWWFNDVQFRKG